jgi:hypothetical protein
VAGVLALHGLSGCAALHRAALRRTEVFYRAETLQRLPEKPPDFPVPALGVRPRGARVLGTFAFTTERNGEFAMESARHNARKCGADAIWVRSLRQWSEPYTQYVPAQTNFTPSTQWISGPVWRPAPGGGRWQREGTFVQTFGLYYSPPYLVSGWNRFTAIDAVMLQLAPTPPAKPQ